MVSHPTYSKNQSSGRGLQGSMGDELRSSLPPLSYLCPLSLHHLRALAPTTPLFCLVPTWLVSSLPTDLSAQGFLPQRASPAQPLARHTLNLFILVYFLSQLSFCLHLLEKELYKRIDIVCLVYCCFQRVWLNKYC